MTLDDSPTTVILEKLATDLGYAMNEIRSWLDGQRIQPVGFKTTLRKTGDVAVEIRFGTEDEAFLFVQRFSLNARTERDGPAGRRTHVKIETPQAPTAGSIL